MKSFCGLAKPQAVLYAGAVAELKQALDGGLEGIERRGVGARLDEQPELLFTLRGVDHEERIDVDAGMAVPATAPAEGGRRIAEEDLGEVFGIELSPGPDESKASPRAASTTPRRGISLSCRPLSLAVASPPMTAETLAVIGTGVAVLAVLVPLILTLHARQAADVADLRREVLQLRKDMAAQGERLARIEGAVLGPWRPEPEGDPQ